MKLYRNILVAAAIVIVGALPAMAQNNSMTPYSKFGYGILNDNVTSAQRNMGGVGYAMNGGRQINTMNPASYASIDSLTFLWDIGIDVTNLWSKEGSTKGNSNGGGLNYITMEFPIAKNVGGSFGLVPYSSVGYSFGSDLVSGSELRDGSGGITQLYGGISYRPFKNFSLGVNGSYDFGTIVNDTYIYTSSSDESMFERVMKLRDWHVQFGVQYTTKINKTDRATIGAVFTPGKSFHGHTWGAKYDVTNSTTADTIGYSSMNGDYTSPASIGGGLGYWHGENLYGEVDFTYQGWKNAKFKSLENFESTTFDNRWKVAAGLQWIPKLRGGYVQRINYRMGGYFTHDYINIKGSNVREYGASIGFGLPVPGGKTIVNLGFEYKHRQANPVSYIKENYFNITLGVNFNELWFWKSKIR